MSNVASDIELHKGLRLMPRLIVAGDLVGGLFKASLTSLNTSDGAAPLLLLDNGLSLGGIKIVSGDPEVDLTPLLGGQLITMYCPVDPGSATLVHESGAVGAAYRFNIFPSSANLPVYRSLTQFVYDQTAQRWFPTNWSSYTGSGVNFASQPSTIIEAIERIAADLAIIKGAPIT